VSERRERALRKTRIRATTKLTLTHSIRFRTFFARRSDSQKVVQLETAMGAAIECFPGATAITVNRTRFAPVKKSDDLLLLRSDAYVISDDFRPILNPACAGGKAPVITLDSKKYKFVQQLERATRCGVPSLVSCTRLTIKGEVWMSRKCIFEGEVSIINNSDEPKFVPGRGERASFEETTSILAMNPAKWLQT